MYMLQLIDNYAATYSLLLITLAECIAINYVYGKFGGWGPLVANTGDCVAYTDHTTAHID